MQHSEKTKKDELNRLHQLYLKRDREFERAQIQRLIITILGFSIFYFLLLWHIADTSTLKNVLWILFISVAIACFHVFINASIFGALSQKSMAENRRLEAIKTEISKLENSN